MFFPALNAAVFFNVLMTLILLAGIPMVVIIAWNGDAASIIVWRWVKVVSLISGGMAVAGLLISYDQFERAQVEHSVDYSAKIFPITLQFNLIQMMIEACLDNPASTNCVEMRKVNKQFLVLLPKEGPREEYDEISGPNLTGEIKKRFDNLTADMHLYNYMILADHMPPMLGSFALTMFYRFTVFLAVFSFLGSIGEATFLLAQARAKKL